MRFSVLAWMGLCREVGLGEKLAREWAMRANVRVFNGYVAYVAAVLVLSTGVVGASAATIGSGLQVPGSSTVAIDAGPLFPGLASTQLLGQAPRGALGHL